MEIIYAIWISAIATGVIAISTALNLWLISKIKSSDDEFHQRVSDLYEAIVISNFMTPEANMEKGGTLEGTIRIFKEYYKGKTEIF